MSVITNGHGPLGQFPLDPATGAGRPQTGLLDGLSVQRFEDAMRAAGAGNDPQVATVAEPQRIAQVQGVGSITDARPVSGVEPAGQVTPVDRTSAAERAVLGLDLDADAGPGQSILDGLGRLRGIFDGQLDGVARYSGGSEMMDVTTMMNLQAEVVKYTVLVDVTSKLAGKSTQALDALMKGQ